MLICHYIFNKTPDSFIWQIMGHLINFILHKMKVLKMVMVVPQDLIFINVIKKIRECSRIFLPLKFSISLYCNTLVSQHSQDKGKIGSCNH